MYADISMQAATYVIKKIERSVRKLAKLPALAETSRFNPGENFGEIRENIPRETVTREVFYATAERITFYISVQA